MVILSVVGARPNFMKLAPIVRELAARQTVQHIVVHTGQHYAPEMSGAFFDDLGIGAPDENLEVGSGTHAEQTAAVMQRFEQVCLSRRPDIVLVYGDVNSTLAAALVAAKLRIKVAHVEAGLRSRDWTMPEEINRVVTDRVSDILFAPSRDAVDNLLAEGVPPARVHFVGNVMIDSLVCALPRAEARAAPVRHGVEGRPYVVVTLHRPGNVDDSATLSGLLEALAWLSRDRPVLFPVHPRTRARINAMNGGIERALPKAHALRLLEPLSYLDMLSLVRGASLVITDSGGLQEETSYLGIPCLTVRSSTERPITCTEGTNRLVPPGKEALIAAASAVATTVRPGPCVIDRWDGCTAERIAAVLCDGATFGWDA